MQNLNNIHPEAEAIKISQLLKAATLLIAFLSEEVLYPPIPTGPGSYTLKSVSSAFRCSIKFPFLSYDSKIKSSYFLGDFAFNISVLITFPFCV